MTTFRKINAMILLRQDTPIHRPGRLQPSKIVHFVWSVLLLAVFATPTLEAQSCSCTSLDLAGYLTFDNNVGIRFRDSAGAFDETGIRRHGGNALRIRWTQAPLILDSMDGQPFQIRNKPNSLNTVVFKLDPEGDAYFKNSGGLGIGTAPSSAVKVDILTDNNVGTGLRFRRTDAKDARIQVGDIAKTWSFAVGWATAGDFSIIEEGVAGDRLYIQQGTGNVGIGTTSPTEKLQVNGNIKLSGSILSDGDICIGNCS